MISPEPIDRSMDSLDRTLKEFFQAEMPKPWPAFQAPRPDKSTIQPLIARNTLNKSRLSLVVATSLMFGFVGLMSSLPQGKPTPINHDEPGTSKGGVAEQRKELLREKK
ncbi:hypothetical protein KIH39_19940 [Telmatocola sphagniphila]|uniref:Uncharacterized protein n=1 Tax=Telmatocola sphagniphila TaxID=1123043 RepID=A0A8E6ESP8_9BACT|nr:hypothetical protein [Telmatocola sphagniphila]QVL31099.1 hypothetical protein KIH39_19940 [Telmatocola sphagniphila]